VMDGGILSPVIESGVLSSPAAAGTNVLDAQGKHWSANVFAHFIVEVYEGRGSPQMRVITSNDKNSLVIDGTWETALAKGAKFRIFSYDPKLSGEVAAIEDKLDDPVHGLAALDTDISAVGMEVANVETKINRELCFKDQWCVTPIANTWILGVAGADFSLSDVVFPASFIPTGATINAVYLMLKWRKQVDSSGAPNAINGASKTIRLKKSTGAWGVDDVIGIMFADNQLQTAASGTEGGDMIIGSYDVKNEVDDMNGVTYNVATRQTARADAPIVDGASLTLYDVYVGLRVYYTL